ncbi:MAG: hypothetical protein LBN04_00925 [Oscillospiraceae bacterium]|jgi:hypothetical protein|nr:hypothetical protein [Oscillospiraceae bacterium]
MISLWVRAIKKQRIVRSEMIEMTDDLQADVGEALARMDLPRPLFLGKHDREWAQFQQTAFLKDHFVEAIPYDKIEIERVDSEAKKAKSQDPRNG